MNSWQYELAPQKQNKKTKKKYLSLSQKTNFVHTCMQGGKKLLPVPDALYMCVTLELKACGHYGTLDIGGSTRGLPLAYPDNIDLVRRAVYNQKNRWSSKAWLWGVAVFGANRPVKYRSPYGKARVSVTWVRTNCHVFFFFYLPQSLLLGDHRRAKTIWVVQFFPSPRPKKKKAKEEHLFD